MDRGVIRGRADAGKAGRAGAPVSAGLLSTDTAFFAARSARTCAPCYLTAGALGARTGVHRGGFRGGGVKALIGNRK